MATAGGNLYSLVGLRRVKALLKFLIAPLLLLFSLLEVQALQERATHLFQMVEDARCWVRVDPYDEYDYELRATVGVNESTRRSPNTSRLISRHCDLLLVNDPILIFGDRRTAASEQVFMFENRTVPQHH